MRGELGRLASTRRIIVAANGHPGGTAYDGGCGDKVDIQHEDAIP